MGDTLTIDTKSLTDTERAIAEFLAAKCRQTEEEKKQKQPWKPESREKYYLITSEATVDHTSWLNWDSDKNRYKVGNCFKTEDDAKFAAERIKVVAELRRFAAEHNPPNFNRNVKGSDKYYLYFDQSQNRVTFAYIAYGFNAECIFASADIAKKAIKEIGEDRLKKYYFEIPEEK